jgi:hypothetical protein
MRSGLGFCLIVVGLCAISAEGQATRRVQATTSVALAPSQMTGMRGSTPAVQPVNINFSPFTMTGLRGFGAAPTPVQIQLNAFVMTGLPVTAPAPVQVNLQPFQMTGMR